MKSDVNGHGHGKPPKACAIDGTVARDVPQTGYKGEKTYTRVDIDDSFGGLHVTVPNAHPLAKARKGAKVTLVIEA